MGGHPRKAPQANMGASFWKAVTGATGWPVSQLCLSLCLFVVEVVASRMTGSLLLLACAFHTLGGVLTLAVALMDIRLTSGRGPSGRDTFGWARVQIAGTLVSSVFLSALCLALLPEALRRAADPRVTDHILVLMGIGAAGIPVHLARERPHGRHPRYPGTRPCCCRRREIEEGNHAQETEDLLGNGSLASGRLWLEDGRCRRPAFLAERTAPRQMFALTWMEACMGPAAVLLYSVIFHLFWAPCLGHVACLSHCPVPPCQVRDVVETLGYGRATCWLLYLDPGLAVALAVALLCLAWPAFRGSTLVLLQALPEGLDLQSLELQLRATEGVAALRELHIWQLDGPGRLVATAHVGCLDGAAYGAVVGRIQQVFCEHGIHAATVQPELVSCPGGGCCKGPADAPHSERPGACPTVVTEYETTL